MPRPNSLCALIKHKYWIVMVATTLSIFVLLTVSERSWSQHIWVRVHAIDMTNSDLNKNDELRVKDRGNNSNFTSPQNLDNFGIKKIYDTKPGGREWYVNMNDPYSDPFFILEGVDVKRQPDGSWRLGGTDIDDQFNDKYHIIMGVNTPSWHPEWKDVEITGYARIMSASEEENEVGLQWYARGGNHTDEQPCEGTSVKGRLHVDGTASWKKEIWHDGGYSDERGRAQATDLSILGRWVGWKVIIYNIENNTSVKMESYIDNENNNNWTQVTELIDSGGWYASSSEEDFFDADCGRPMDYVVTNSGPVASFRSDGILWDFKNLSIREIQPPLTNN